MLSVKTPPQPPVTSTTGQSVAMDEIQHHHEIVLPDMDHLLSKLRRNMVELILQGDDVTRQMWRMYSVFEEIFGPQKISSKPVMKPVVVGDKIQQAAAAAKTPATVSDTTKTSSSGSVGAPTTLTITTSPSSTANGANKTATAAGGVVIVAPTTTTAGVASAVITSLTATTSTTANSSNSVITSCAAASNASFVTTSVCSSSPVAAIVTATTIASTPTTISSPSVCSDDATSRNMVPVSQTDRRIPPRNKQNQRPASADSQIMQQRPPEFNKANNASDQQSPGSAIPSSTGSSMQDITGRIAMPTSNPLLDTIGALAGSNPDSDDSDLDIVYQQLRYRGRHRRQDQGGRLKTQRSQRRHQQHFANSDPESTSYAGSNSIDSGYKSQCATPEVSDSLSAPEVRRSASDVSASDSSTTSGRPRSSDGGLTDSKSVKIKMGTRSIAGKMTAAPCSKRRQPFLESSMNDVTLDHLMYLRQSMRKDYMPSSSQGSMPSSSASSTVRDELSPTILTDEESNYGQDMPLTPHDTMVQRNVSPQRQRPSYHSPTAYSPIDGAMFLGGNGVSRSVPGSRSGRRLSSGSEPAPDTTSGTSPTSEDFLLSGMEYYDLDSVHDFPQRRSYFALMEEKSRCSRIHLMAASKRDVQAGQHDPFPKKRKDPMVRSMPADVNMYGISRHPHENTSVIMSHHRSRHHHAQQQQQQQREIHHAPTVMAPTPTGPPRASDSKLTEAAIRVLQMIEDFRMEEAIGNATAFDVSERGMRSNVSVTSVGPHAFVPRFRRTSGTTSRSAYVRPASTGSLIGSDDVPLDTRSIASSSSYAASAEHHVYEEIMYDLVCERSGVRPEQHSPMGPVAHMSGGTSKSRNRYLPANPMSTGGVPHAYHHTGPEQRAMMAVRSHKHRSNMYSVITDEDPRNSPDPFIDMEWNVPRGRRDNIPPDYPV